MPISTVIPSGEQTIVHFWAGKDDPLAGPIIKQLLRTGRFSVQAFYTDAAGGHRALTRLDVHLVDESDWRVVRIHLCDPETGEPYLSSAPVL